MSFTEGEILFYGGIIGAVLCVLIVMILLKTFEKKRKKELEKIMRSL